MAVEVLTHRFTVADYHLMAEARILHEDDRVELFQGDVIQMCPKRSVNTASVNRFSQSLLEKLRGRAIVGVHDPIQLDEYSEPEPDLVVARHRPDFYASGHPQPQDILLIVEVADGSVAYDRNRKIPAYAAAGIPEAWLADLTQGVLEVYRSPSATGYQQRQHLRGSDLVSPQAFPDCGFVVSELLGMP